MSIFYLMWHLLVLIVPKSHIQLVQNISEAPHIKGKWEFSLCMIFFSPFISSKRSLRWEFDGVASVVWGLSRAVRGPAHGFFIALVMHVSADIQGFQRLLGLNYCSHIRLELGFVHMLSQTWFSLPSPPSLRSRTSPLGGSRCIWGAVDASCPVEWTLYRPFSMHFLFSPHDHRNAAIITVMIYGSAPFHSESCIGVPRRAHAVATTMVSACDFQADREQDRHRRLTPQLSETLQN